MSQLEPHRPPVWAILDKLDEPTEARKIILADRERARIIIEQNRRR